MTTSTPMRLACLASGLFLFLYLLLGTIGWAPSSQSLASIGEASYWCERVYAGLFREPVNALSNLGFMLAGLLMFYVLSKDQDTGQSPNPLTGFTPLSILYASAVIWLGPGSMLMHGTHTAWGGWADNLSMVMYILIPWLINVGAMARWSSTRVLQIYFVIVFTYAISRWFFGGRLGVNLDLFSLSIALWGISECLLRFWSPAFRWLSGFIGFLIAAAFGIMPWDMLAAPEKFWWIIFFWLPALFASHPPGIQRTYVPWYLLGIAAYMIAFSIWLKGRPGDPWCDPDSVIQMHGIWHLLSAVATWCFFKFLRTERAHTL